MAHLHWCLDGWVSHEGLPNVFYLQFGILWVQARSTSTSNCTSGFQSSPYILHFILLYWVHPAPLNNQPTLLLPRAISLPSQKSCSKRFKFLVFEWKLFTHTIMAMNRQVLVVNLFLQHKPPGSYCIMQLLLKFTISLNVALYLEARFSQIQSHM